MKQQESPELTLKKQTLTAWTQILYNQGMIDFAKRGRMLALIERMQTPTERKSAAS